MRQAALLTLILLAISHFATASEVPIWRLDRGQQTDRQADDLAVLTLYRNGLSKIAEHAQAKPDLFPHKPVNKRLLTSDEKYQARQIWVAMLDYHIALEALERYHTDFYLLSNLDSRERSLLITFAARSARYRYALDFITLVEHNSELYKVLDEPIAELGLPKNSYTHFKSYFLSPSSIGQYAALTLLYGSIRTPYDRLIAGNAIEDRKRLLQLGHADGARLTATNALAVVRGMAQRALFPLQASISEWMGATRVVRKHDYLISKTQIDNLVGRLLPGDLLLQRREWYVSNIGLPGFWSHAAIYIGDAKQRSDFFADPEVQTWVKEQGIKSGEFELLLQQRYPQAYHSNARAQVATKTPRVLEALGKGVVFTALEDSAMADSLVVLRPRLSKRNKAYALLRAFAYAGRPYDYDFDFQTDNSLVCTELVYKAFEPTDGFSGIAMQPLTIAGRLVVPANEIARQFSATYETPEQQWDMIIFLDGDERNKRAVESTLEAFMLSWQRPKWHVLMQNASSPSQ